MYGDPSARVAKTQKRAMIQATKETKRMALSSRHWKSISGRCCELFKYIKYSFKWKVVAHCLNNFRVRFCSQLLFLEIGMNIVDE